MKKEVVNGQAEQFLLEKIKLKFSKEKYLELEKFLEDEIVEQKVYLLVLVASIKN